MASPHPNPPRCTCRPQPACPIHGSRTTWHDLLVASFGGLVVVAFALYELVVR
jgi:hypothetical protein